MSLHVAAKHLASKGRDGDTELVHMTKGEIKGLQALAVAHGGSLSINPDTGLVEASFLKKMLPTIAGIGLSLIPGVGPLAAAGIVGGFETMRTGDIGKGLLAGLGAYGGAGIGQGLATAGQAAQGLELGSSALGAEPTMASISEKLATATPETTDFFAKAYEAGAAPADTIMGRASQMSSGIGSLGTEGGRSLAYSALPTGTLPSAGAALANAATPEYEIPTDVGTSLDDKYKRAPYSYGLASNFQGYTPPQPNPYYRPIGLGYAEGGDVKKEEAAAAPAFQPRSELGQNFVKGALGEPRLKTYQVTDPVAQVLPYLAGAKMRSILPEELQDKMASLFRPAAPIAPVSGGVPEGYVIDRATGQLVPMGTYNPSGLGYQGYAEGGDIMTAAGGTYDDEPQGDMPSMAAGGIAAYASQGQVRHLPRTPGIPDVGIFRDTDQDTAKKDALEAALILNKKAAGAANMPKKFLAKQQPTSVKGLGDIEEVASGGSIGGYSDGGRMLKGPGDGMSDSIPATIGKRQPARLADGEFVVPADVVSHLGNGSTDAGARKLYSMMDKVRKARTGKKKQAPAVKTSRFMPA